MIEKVKGLVFVIFLLTLSSCEKKPFDYRNKFLGEYSMTYEYSYWQMGGVTGDTTIHYIGVIDYGEKGELQIEWYNGEIYNFAVSKDGVLSKCNDPLGEISKQKFNLSFTDDLCGTGPLGANYTIKLHGDKN